MDISKVVKVIDMAGIYKAQLWQAYEVIQIRMDQLMSFRKILGQIEFQCQWNEDGHCFAELKEDKQNSMCCCVVCPSTVGFMTEDPTPVFQSDLPAYQDRWDDKYGFWRPSGCSLPDVMRATTCLTYNCLHLIGTAEARDKRMVINDVRLSMDRLTKEIITINERIAL
jgi:hypothetical protein